MWFPLPFPFAFFSQYRESRPEYSSFLRPKTPLPFALSPNPYWGNATQHIPSFFSPPPYRGMRACLPSPPLI